MNLLQRYQKKILIKDLLQKTNQINWNRFPSLSHLSINFSSKTALTDEKSLLPNFTSLEILTGQCFQSTRARKSIANFHLREGQVLGCKTHLRRRNLYNFLQNWSQVGLAKDRLFCGLEGLNSGFLDILQFIELERTYDFFHQSKTMNVNLAFQCPESKPMGSEGFELKFRDSKRSLSKSRMVSNGSLTSIFIEETNLTLTGLQVPIYR